MVLGLASTATLAATGVLNVRRAPPPASCAAPALAGTVVDVTLADMGGMMGPYWDGARDKAAATERAGRQMMHILATPSAVAPGPVSLRVHNSGALTHEVLVLPLAADQLPGLRAIGADGRVDESDSLGEASRSCGADGGDGIVPGAMAWTTVTLPRGRYELLCNIAGHYGAGMYAEVDAVVGR